MVKRTITITTILLILTIAVSLIVVLNKEAFAADDDIASGTCGTCSWVIDKDGLLTISPTDGVSGTLESRDNWENTSFWKEYANDIKKIYAEPGTKMGKCGRSLFRELTECTEMDLHNIDTSNCEQINAIFYDCTKVEKIDVSTWDTSKVGINGGFGGTFSAVFKNCYSLKSVDVTSFDVSGGKDIYWMFYSCSSLESLDLSSFNTSNVTSAYDFLFNCYNLRSVVLGENFSFVGKIPENERKILLPTPPYSRDGINYSGKWIREDTAYGPYNSEELKNNYTSEMAGTWIWEKANAIVNFNANGGSFKNNNNTTVSFTHKEGTSPFHTLGTNDVVYPKHTLLGWSENKNATVPTYGPDTEIDIAELGVTKTLYAIYSVNPDASYSIEHYIQNIKSNTYSLKKSESYTGEVTTITEAEPKNFEGFTFDSSVEGTKLSGNIALDGSLVLKLYYTRNSYEVTYSFISPPDSVSEKPPNATYEYQEEVTVAENGIANGYTFNGWSRTGTFEMPAEDVVITGSFTPRTDTPYKVEYYLEDLKADTYTLKKTDNLTGTTDTEATAEEREYEGFTFDSSINGTKLSGNIAGDGSLVLKLYYKRNSYNVTYSYTGDIPDDASALPQQETYEYGEELNVPEEATAEGYTFSGWIKDYINMPAKDIEITGYFIENPKSYRYKVEYFFDGELDDTLDEILNAEKDEEISIIPQTPLRHGEKNYTLVSNNHKITITVNDEDNVIKVYYETDVLDYAIDNFEDESAGDGISDKYQIRITYKVENGSWNDGTKDTKINVITLKDKDGNPSENGTGNTKIPEVGSKPNKGYTYGYWNKNIPSKVTKNDDGKEYVYSYETIKTIEADIAGRKGKSSNPKTDDVMNRYLLSGVGGILVLTLVSRIRRIYSRKAKKIQF